MITALYYPHTTIQSKGLIKTALLLWDSIECIVPKTGWKVKKHFNEKIYNEALELIAKPIVPNRSEKEHAHKFVEDYLKEDGNRFFLENALHDNYQSNYQIYPDKFLYHTWEVLEHHGLAKWDSMSLDYVVPPALGLLMMSSLAEACAGTQKQKVTDRVHAYSLLERARAASVGAPFVEGLDISQVAPELDRLVMISLRVLGAKNIPIKNLLEFRKREATGRSSDYRKLRITYLNALRSYVDRMTNEAKTQRDIKDIETQFKADIRDDLISLKHELNLASITPLFSKEMALTMIALGGAFVEPISGLTNLAITMQGVGIIPLVNTRLKHKKERRKALLEHKISWLYLSQEKKLSLR